MDFSIEGKVFVITGAGAGFGEAIAKGMAEAGAKMVCADVNLENAERTVSAIGRSAIAVSADVSMEEDVIRLMKKAHEVFGRIDVMVNNAGIAINAPIEDMTLDQWHRVLGVNLDGVFLCSKHVVPYMASQKSGVIINMTSVMGVRGVPGLSAYAASKAAVSNFTNVLHQEVSHLGIRVVGIAPGLTDTALSRKTVDEAHFQRVSSQYVGGKVGQPEDIVGFVQFLSSEAAAAISGTVLAFRP